MNNFIVALADKCIGCHTCEVACAAGHAGASLLSVQHYFPRLNVVKSAKISVPVMCRQCDNAPCIAVCPVAALHKGDHRVEAVSERCIDCKSCVIACPFGAIEIVNQAQAIPQIIKCDLCREQANGPACVNVCPTNALSLMTDNVLEQQYRQKQQRAAREGQLSGAFVPEVTTHG